MYIVIEIQNSGTVATIVNQYADKNTAESAYHQILSAAAVSSVPTHAAVLMTDEGVWLRSEVYHHAPAPAPEPEPEPEPENEPEDGE